MSLWRTNRKKQWTRVTRTFGDQKRLRMMRKWHIRCSPNEVRLPVDQSVYRTTFRIYDNLKYTEPSYAEFCKMHFNWYDWGLLFTINARMGPVDRQNLLFYFLQYVGIHRSGWGNFFIRIYLSHQGLLLWMTIIFGAERQGWWRWSEGHGSFFGKATSISTTESIQIS